MGVGGGGGGLTCNFKDFSRGIWIILRKSEVFSLLNVRQGINADVRISQRVRIRINQGSAVAQLPPLICDASREIWHMACLLKFVSDQIYAHDYDMSYLPSTGTKSEINKYVERPVVLSKIVLCSYGSVSAGRKNGGLTSFSF